MMKHGRSDTPGYGGRIGASVHDSTPWWPGRANSGGPNIVVILLDDVGYAQLGCYGSSIATPAMDALAAGGRRYSNFHVAALCSPTRASLLTGRNHHSVGMGFLGAFDTGFPGYRGEISTAAATIGEMLQPQGYGTYAVGKWHLTPPGGMSAAGPFDQWPTQRGFDRYYGFLWGEDDQWTPELWYDQHHVEVPDDPDYHLTVDLVDRAAEFVNDHVTSRPDDPFLLYVAMGACHAPHQAPREYIDKYRGAFDHGWDEERRRVLERQIALGLAPEGTVLTDRNPGVPAWDSLTAEERTLFSRFQEAFAGFMNHTDEQIGRLIDHITEIGEIDNTVFVLMSDNGASGEGGRDGTINEYRYFLGIDDSIDDAISAIDDIGSPAAHNQYPAGWAQAGNAPFQYYKKFTHGGGVRAPLILSTPATRAEDSAGGEIRSQFHHVVDIVPTLLELVGVDAPDIHRGVEQLPVHGTSMAYTLDQPGAPSTRGSQYFETAGNRGIYLDGWKAVVAHKAGTPFEADSWQLFRVEDDFSESHDLAADEPEVLGRMIAAWNEAAHEFGVLPLDDRMGERVVALDPAADRPRYVMRQGTRFLNHVVGPSFSERSFAITASPVFGLDTEGVILAYGRRAFGFSLFVKGGMLMADINLAGRHTMLSSGSQIQAGQHDVRFAVDVTGSGPVASLDIDGVRADETPLSRLIPGGIGTLSIQCGYNEPSPVSPEYVAPFRFTGTLGDVVIELAPRGSRDTLREMDAELAAQ